MQPAHQQFPVRVQFCLTFSSLFRRLGRAFVAGAVVHYSVRRWWFFYLTMSKITIVIWCWKKASRFSLDLLMQTYAYYFLSTRSLSLSLALSRSFFLPFLLCRCFSLSLTSDEVWKLRRFCRSRNLTGYCAAPHQTIDNYAPMKVRPFEVQVTLLFEVIFAMLDHFFVFQRVAWGVLFLSNMTMEASSTDANLFFVGGSVDIYSSLNCRSNKGLVNIAIPKQKTGKKAFLLRSRPLKAGPPLIWVFGQFWLFCTIA